MGMFSFICKGCNHEIKQGEYVRLNGCIGTYDGYGRAGGYQYSDSNKEPSAWHNRCYNKAPDQQKLNEEPSKHAPNQGFGIACLENQENYEPEAKTIYQPIIYVDHYDYKTQKTTKQQWHIINDVLVDVLVDQPKTNAKWFEDFEKTKQTIETLIPTLPNPDWGYELAIYGKQEKAEGLYYKYNKIPNLDPVPIPGEYYPHGGQKHDLVYNNTFNEEIAYIHGRPAGNGIKSY